MGNLVGEIQICVLGRLDFDVEHSFSKCGPRREPGGFVEKQTPGLYPGAPEPGFLVVGPRDRLLTVPSGNSWALKF